MKKIGDMSLWSFDEIIDAEIRKVDTPERTTFDAKAEERLKYS